MKIIAFIVGLVGILAAVFYYQKNDKPKGKSDFDSIEVSNTLEVQVKAIRECQTGDLDLILSDLEFPRNKRVRKNLLLTLETIVPGSKTFKPVVKRMSAKELEFGTSHTFKVGKRTRVEHLGVFLCKDNKKSGSCARKRIANYQNIQRNLLAGGNLKRRDDDKPYFFQHLMLKKKELVFLTDNVKSLKEAKKRIDQITLKTVPNKKERKRIRKRSKHLLSALGSFVTTKEPVNGNQVLQVTLSKFSQKKCDELAPKLKRKHYRKSKRSIKRSVKPAAKSLPTN